MLSTFNLMHKNQKLISTIQLICDFEILVFSKNKLFFKSFFGTQLVQILENFSCGLSLFENQIKIQFFFKKTKLKKIDYIFLKSYINQLLTKLRLLIIGKRFDLLLQGIGFRIYLNKSKQIAAFKLGYSHKIYYKIPTGIWLRIFNRYTFVLFGGNLFSLKQALKTILCFRKPDAYKGKGIKIKGSKLKIKEGKKQI